MGADSRQKNYDIVYYRKKEDKNRVKLLKWMDFEEGDMGHKKDDWKR